MYGYIKFKTRYCLHCFDYHQLATSWLIQQQLKPFLWFLNGRCGCPWFQDIVSCFFILSLEVHSYINQCYFCKIRINIAYSLFDSSLPCIRNFHFYLCKTVQLARSFTHILFGISKQPHEEDRQAFYHIFLGGKWQFTHRGTRQHLPKATLPGKGPNHPRVARPGGQAQPSTPHPILVPNTGAGVKSPDMGSGQGHQVLVKVQTCLYFSL